MRRLNGGNEIMNAEEKKRKEKTEENFFKYDVMF